MKYLLVLLLVASAGIYFFRDELRACFRKDTPLHAKEQVIEHQSASMPSSPVPKRLAPDGIFFLAQRITVPTDSGVIGVAPGTKVMRIGTQGSTLTVTDGEHQFHVPIAALTRDMDLAARLASADQMTQARNLEAIAAQKRDMQGRQQNAQAQADQRQGGSEPAAILPALPAVNPLDRNASNSTSGRKYVETLPNGGTRTYWVDTAGRRHYE